MKGCTLPTRSVYPTAAATDSPSTQYRVTQLGIQFFQISNDGESWKTLQEFDDNLRKKYMLRRVRPLFDGSVDLNVKNPVPAMAGYGGHRDVQPQRDLCTEIS